MSARKSHLRSSPPRDALTFTLPGASALSGLSVATLRRRAKPLRRVDAELRA